jgi:hypothetical protein
MEQRALQLDVSETQPHVTSSSPAGAATATAAGVENLNQLNAGTRQAAA